MSTELIYKDDKAYLIERSISIHNFLNSDGTTNNQVLGMWVNHLDCNKVFQKDNHFLICKEIEEANIVE